ncbi:MAG: hypothetical protein ABI860_11750 [Gemmatimonadales bacterium]
MDPGSLGALVPVAAILVWGAVKIANIQARGRAGADPDTAARLQAVEAELGTVRQELGEVHERLDFTERLLAQREPTRLDPPA